VFTQALYKGFNHPFGTPLFKAIKPPEALALHFLDVPQGALFIGFFTINRGIQRAPNTNIY
jgi:hypothetical protein